MTPGQNDDGLDARCEAAVERWVAQAPPLSEKQKDLIAATFAGALPAPKRGKDGAQR